MGDTVAPNIAPEKEDIRRIDLALIVLIFSIPCFVAAVAFSAAAATKAGAGRAFGFDPLQNMKTQSEKISYADHLSLSPYWGDLWTAPTSWA